MIWHVLTTRETVKDGERALLTRDGRVERVLEPGRHRLFDLRGQLTAEIFNAVRTEFPAERYAVLKAARPDLAAELFEAVETKANEIAIVSLDGQPVHLMTEIAGKARHLRVIGIADHAPIQGGRWRAHVPRRPASHIRGPEARPASPLLAW